MKLRFELENELIRIGRSRDDWENIQNFLEGYQPNGWQKFRFWNAILFIFDDEFYQTSDSKT